VKTQLHKMRPKLISNE